MISTAYWTLLEDAHRQLALRLRKLRKERATTGNSETLKHSEMDYFQALQVLYTTAQDAANASRGLTYERDASGK